jgi:hypothetical protein
MSVYYLEKRFITIDFYLFIHLNLKVLRNLTNFVELSPSTEAANGAPTQELPSILWNRKIHFRVHKIPPLVPILSHIDPVHTTPFYLSKIHFHIIY